MADLLDRLQTEQKLREVWQYLPDQSSGFSIDMCADAEVTIASAEAPYDPVNRFASLLDDTESCRFAGFDVTLLEPCKDEFCERVLDGMDAEMINPPRVANYIRNNCPELFSKTLDSGNLSVRLHDELPAFGVCLLDHRIAISGYDHDGVMVRVLVDTDADEAREWAESFYATYRRETPTIPLGSPTE
jgi:predicted transcriptional regulator